MKYDLLTCKHPENIIVYTTFIKVLAISKDRVSMLRNITLNILAVVWRIVVVFKMQTKMMRRGSVLPIILSSLYAKQAIMDEEIHQVENTYLLIYQLKNARTS